MSERSTAYNPFMLMLNPEVVIAAMEKSERLAQLNRHQCRPLDRIVPGTSLDAATTDEPTVDDDAQDPSRS
jgi:hypothetical protein